MLCDFIKSSFGEYKCQRCGYIIKSKSDKVYRNCRPFEEKENIEDFGVGTELKKLLGRIGIIATENCKCNKRAKIMDENGPDWCEKNIDEISGWLREEANKRGLPYFDLVGKALIRRAIKRFRKSQT